MTNRDERVLQLGAPLVVRMHIPGRDRRHSQVVGELEQLCVPSRVAPLERTLQLDIERTLKRRREASGSGRVAVPDSVTCASREADEPLGMRADLLDRRRRR